jgi:hypothetical protein
MALKAFRARLHLLRTDDGGRKGPARSGWSPLLDLGVVHEGHKTFNSSRIAFPNAEWVYPGDTQEAVIYPLHPDLVDEQIWPGRTFDVGEPRVVAKGEVLERLDASDSRIDPLHLS